MADNPSAYVTLKKETINEQADEGPGELSQPVDVPALREPRCMECGQVLPRDFVPPQDEPWSTGIFDCHLDRDNCMEGAFCPCVLFGRQVEAIKSEIPARAACICHGVLVEGGLAAAGVLACLPIGVPLDPGTYCLLWESLALAWWMCGIYTGLFRQELQRKYHLKNAPCDPCCVHCFLHQCALCQEHREMKQRLMVDDEASLMHPPTEQEMTPPTERESDGLVL